MTLQIVTRDPEISEATSPVHVQQLRLSYVAVKVAGELYEAARIYWPDHPDYPEDFGNAPSWIQTRLYRLADEMVARVNEANDREAKRLAELAFDESLNRLERDALVFDADYSHRNVIEDAFARLRRLIQREKPIGAALSVFKQACRKEIR